MPVKTVQNKLSLRWAQGRVFSDRKRFRVLLAGRRFGKTVLALVELLRAATERQGTYFYCAPSYRMAKDIAWDLSKQLIPPKWVKKRHEGELKISLINGSVIELKGTDNPDSLRGRSLCGAVLDECAFMQEAVWRSIIRPALSDQLGWCLFITTPSPEGTAGWFYELVLALTKPEAVDHAERLVNDQDWSVYHFTTLDGGNVPASEIAQARAELDSASFRREYLAEFLSNYGLVASCFSDDNISINAVDIEQLPLRIGIDFNADPISAVVTVIHKDTLYVHDEIVIANATTWDLCAEIHTRYGENRTIYCYPDPTGDRRQTSAVGLSDHAILRRAGFRVIAPKKPWIVRDKVMAVNAALRTADEQVHTYIHPKCRELIKSFRSLGYKPGTSIPNKDLGVDHSFDAFGYLVLSGFNLARPKVNADTGFRIY